MGRRQSIHPESLVMKLIREVLLRQFSTHAMWQYAINVKGMQSPGDKRLKRGKLKYRLFGRALRHRI